MGKYWEDDTEDRKRYFERLFFSFANDLATRQGLTLNQFLSNLIDFNSFKSYLDVVFSEDNSLANYVSGMRVSEKEDFFNRNKIQRVIDRNLEEKTSLTPKQQRNVAVAVQRIEKKTREFFNAVQKGRKIRAYRVYIYRRGKRLEFLRDLRGRFAKRL